jgi:hypothetical protein
LFFAVLVSASPSPSPSPSSIPGFRQYDTIAYLEEAFDGYGSTYNSSSDLELTFDQGSAIEQAVAIMFDIQQNQNTLILNAYVQFTATERQSGAVNITICGEATTDPSSFGTSAFNVSSRISTKTCVQWSPPTWEAMLDHGPAQQTPDLSTILQEIMFQPSWSLNSKIVLVIFRTPGYNVTTLRNSFSGDGYAPRLVLTICENCSEFLTIFHCCVPNIFTAMFYSIFSFLFSIFFWSISNLQLHL